jgi:glyoxylase-like metal-dependent hydrolase (beta-lactamase superfamily II)
MRLATLTIDCVRTTGIFSLDGSDFEVENNVWLVGDDDEVLVIDGAHQADLIFKAVRGRSVVGIVCTHGHNDHINAAVALSELADGAPIALHPADRMLWDQVHPGRGPELALADGDSLDVAGNRIEVIHTPGHSPGGVCLYLGSADVLFSGDTLFRGGPGATGRSWSDFPTIITSIRDRLLTLPRRTVIHSGHGNSTTIGTEARDLDAWIERGY